MTHMKRWAAVAVCVLGSTAAAHADWRPDAWITAKTKIAMLTTEDLPTRDVHVDTVDGNVTLHGTVHSAAEKAKAEQVARSIEGVKDIRDLLQVVPQGREKAVKASDADIQKQVEHALHADPRLKGSSISVQSVNQGVVLLSGKAASVSDQLDALQDAWKVAGVQRVTSEIEGPDKLADDQIRQSDQGRRAGDQPPSSAGVSDAWITTKAKMRLLADSDTPAMSINVDTRDGVVTLFGIVPDRKAKAAAAADIRKVSGVKKVVNDLQIVPSSRQRTVKAQDDVIERQVKDTLAGRPELKDASIDVDVKNGIVRLTGKVPSEFQSLAAAVAARSTPGVRSVENQLRISASQPAA